LPPLGLAKSNRNKIKKKVIEQKQFSYYVEVKNKPKNNINNFFFTLQIKNTFPIKILEYLENNQNLLVQHK